MKLTAKILKFKGKKLETVEEVRAALIAMGVGDSFSSFYAGRLKPEHPDQPMKYEAVKLLPN